MMEDGMLIIEAKDMAADKMSKGHSKKDKKEKNVDGDLMGSIKDLLDNWPDHDHEYFKDLVKVYTSNGGEYEEEEEEEEEY